MAAQSVSVFALEFDNPEWYPGSDNKEPINSDISFNVQLDTIQTLSTNTVAAGSDIEGLLYVPNLQASDPCADISKLYMPKNVTRQANLPDNDYSRVAFAPWISTACTKSYLAAAGADRVKALIFYLANNSSSEASSDTPPSPNDPVWDLHDGGSWKAQNSYPVYAVDAPDGLIIMEQLSLYSGNMTDAPNGTILTGTYDPRNYVRLYTAFDTGDASTLPNLWAFLLIILGILLLIVGATSLMMNFVQRRRRQQLRRLIASGQVDLEALGIKRLKVPEEILDTMPLFIYVAGDHAKSQSITTISDRRSSEDRDQESLQTDNVSLKLSPVSSPAALESNLPPPSQLPHRVVLYAQPSCPICLDEFVSHKTIVRSLPCTHIYHPECIDPVLRNHSSLCPICKGKVLPIGYCPDIVTNNMVRRERLIRRLRERVNVDDFGEDDEGMSVGRRMASFHRQVALMRRTTNWRETPIATPAAVELLDSRPPAREATVSSNSLVPPASLARRPPTISRAEWAGRRASALIGQRHMAEDEDRERQVSLPKWRQAMGKVFPGF